MVVPSRIVLVSDAYAAASNALSALAWVRQLRTSVMEAEEGLGVDEPSLDSQAAAGLLAWAEKASLVASPDRLATALEESPGPFGGGILKFAEALGIAERPG